MINLHQKKAQAIIEFTFAMIIIVLMIYGTIMIFRWTGTDLAERRIAHDTRLLDVSLSTLGQLDPHFHEPLKMNAIWAGF